MSLGNHHPKRKVIGAYCRISKSERKKRGLNMDLRIRAVNDPHLGAETEVQNQRHRGLPSPSTEAEHQKT